MGSGRIGLILGYISQNQMLPFLSLSIANLLSFWYLYQLYLFPPFCKCESGCLETFSASRCLGGWHEKQSSVVGSCLNPIMCQAVNTIANWDKTTAREMGPRKSGNQLFRIFFACDTFLLPAIVMLSSFKLPKGFEVNCLNWVFKWNKRQSTLTMDMDGVEGGNSGEKDTSKYGGRRNKKLKLISILS
jgi:hypothetical protein